MHQQLIKYHMLIGLEVVDFFINVKKIIAFEVAPFSILPLEKLKKCVFCLNIENLPDYNVYSYTSSYLSHKILYYLLNALEKMFVFITAENGFPYCLLSESCWNR